MFYYLYKITNAVNGKIYVGVHKTKNLDDGYMGSGKVIKRAIVKHGISNFSKDILEFFDNDDLMYAREVEVVNEEFLAREDVYNLRRGGHGGFEYINKLDSKTITSKTGYTTMCSKLYIKYGSNWQNIIVEMSNDTMRSKKIGVYSDSYVSKFKDPVFQHENMLKACSTEAKIKRKDTFSKIAHQQGEKNSQFGMMWITNEVESKKIKKTDLIPDGFRKGRTLIKI